MFYIFILVVVGIIYFWFKAKSRVQSTEFGVEARHIACNELGVPLSVFNYMTQHEIEDIKVAALRIQNAEQFYSSMSWPRLLAWTIYGGYKYDCNNAYFQKNVNSLERLRKYGVTDAQISNEANLPHKAEHYLNSNKSS